MHLLFVSSPQMIVYLQPHQQYTSVKQLWVLLWSSQYWQPVLLQLHLWQSLLDSATWGNLASSLDLVMRKSISTGIVHRLEVVYWVQKDVIHIACICSFLSWYTNIKNDVIKST